MTQTPARTARNVPTMAMILRVNAEQGTMAHVVNQVITPAMPFFEKKLQILFQGLLFFDKNQKFCSKNAFFLTR